MTGITLLGRSGDSFEASVSAQGVERLRTRWLPLPALEDELTRSPACHDGSVDVVLVPADMLPGLASSGSIRPLDDLARRAPLPGGTTDRSSVLDASLIFRAGHGPQRWGSAFHCGPQLVLRRRDLYEDPREQERFAAAHGRPLLPPASWADIDEQAAWFTRPEQGLHGTVLAGAPDGHSNVYDLVLQLRRAGGDVLAPDGRSNGFEDGPAAAALAWLRRTFDTAVDPAAREWDSVRSGRAFAEGRVALMVNWAGYAGLGDERIGASVVPAVETVAAFWALAITSGSRSPDLAWRFLQRCASAAGDRASTAAGSTGVRRSTWSHPAMLERNPALALFEQAYRRARPLPVHPRLTVMTAVLGELVQRVVHEGADAASSIARAARAVDAIVQDHPAPVRTA